MPSKKRKTKRTPKKLNTATRKKANSKRAKAPKKLTRKAQTKKKTSAKTAASGERKTPIRRTQKLESSWAKRGAIADRQSGDLEGLSRIERADSESVDELVEEGNAFEAGAVAGVEEADDQETSEVHTHEVPEDDVPKEYLDKD